MVQTHTNTGHDRSLPQGTLSLTDPRVFREGGRIDFARLNQLADAAKRGVMSGGENFAYEPVKSEKEADKEARAENAFLRQEVLATIAENAETAHDALAASTQPVTRTVSYVDLGGGSGYTDVTFRDKNGDYLGGMCMAPGAATTSFAKESDNFASRTAQAEDNIFIATGKKGLAMATSAYDSVTDTLSDIGNSAKKKFGGFTDSLSNLFSDSNKGTQIKVESPQPKTPAPVATREYEAPQPTYWFGA